VSRPRAVTEADVRRASGGDRTIAVPADAVVTPAARDLAAELGVALSRGAAQPAPRPIVALGADHGGFPLKEQIKTLLGELGMDALDLGTHSSDPVDYPDYAVAVARAVAQRRAWRGIVVDGAGIGSAMAANKISGIRAAPCHDVTTAANAREHNDANVLTLGGGLIGARLAGEIVRTFLATEFAGGRHAARVAKIEALDTARR
jgi:ribose 5-phosphate isomerase B